MKGPDAPWNSISHLVEYVQKKPGIESDYVTRIKILQLVKEDPVLYVPCLAKYYEDKWIAIGEKVGLGFEVARHKYRHMYGNLKKALEVPKQYYLTYFMQYCIPFIKYKNKPKAYPFELGELAELEIDMDQFLNSQRLVIKKPEKYKGINVPMLVKRQRTEEEEQERVRKTNETKYKKRIAKDRLKVAKQIPSSKNAGSASESIGSDDIDLEDLNNMSPPRRDFSFKPATPAPESIGSDDIDLNDLDNMSPSRRDFTIKPATATTPWPEASTATSTETSTAARTEAWLNDIDYQNFLGMDIDYEDINDREMQLQAIMDIESMEEDEMERQRKITYINGELKGLNNLQLDCVINCLKFLNMAEPEK